MDENLINYLNTMAKAIDPNDFPQQTQTTSHSKKRGFSTTEYENLNRKTMSSNIKHNIRPSEKILKNKVVFFIFHLITIFLLGLF